MTDDDLTVTEATETDRVPAEVAGSHESGRLLRIIGGSLLAILVAALGGVAWMSAEGQPRGSESVGQSGSVINVSMDQSEILVACPPGVIDPVTLVETSPGTMIGVPDSLALTALEGGGNSLQLPAATELSPSSLLTTSGLDSGDLASMLVEGCTLPSTSQLLPVGSTQIGENAVLILSNPNAKAVNVSVQVLTAIGSGLETPVQVTVPGQSTVAVLPAAWVAGNDRVALLIESDGHGVSAWLQTSGMDGELPQGLGRLVGQVSAAEQTLPGLDSTATQTLRIANPNNSAIKVDIALLAAGGPVAVPGATEVEVDANSVTDLEIKGLPSDALALQLNSEQSFAAALVQQTGGNPFAQDSSLNVSLRDVIGSTNPVEHVEFPSAQMVTENMEVMGFGSIVLQLVVANPNDQPVDLHLPDEEVQLLAGSSRAIPIDLTAGSAMTVLDASAPVHVALVVDAESAAGRNRSVVPADASATQSMTRAVEVFPTRNR